MSIVSSVQLVLDRLNLPKDKKVSVAVSGGADSTALLRILHMIGIDCTLVHLNHKLRGQESDDDEKFVKNLAEELSIPFIIKSENVHAYAKRKKISREMAGRETRHLFFNSLPINFLIVAVIIINSHGASLLISRSAIDYKFYIYALSFLIIGINSISLSPAMYFALYSKYICLTFILYFFVSSVFTNPGDTEFT